MANAVVVFQIQAVVSHYKYTPSSTAVTLLLSPPLAS